MSPPTEPTASPWVSLADFAASFDQGPKVSAPSYAHPTGPPVGLLDRLPGVGASGMSERLDEVLDTVTALQRADWLQDGVYVGPRAMPDVYRDLLDSARALGIAVPAAVVTGCAMKSQGAYGTNDRAYLLLSTFFLHGASSPERRFLLGRLCGHLHARQVTWSTLYALLVDQDGVRRLARSTLGPTLEVVLAPLSLGARLALSRWHRAAEITADRAGLVCCGNLDAARHALLRMALHTRQVDPSDYLEQLRTARAEDSPARWAELLASQPWMHKRMAALDLFHGSALWHELRGEAAPPGAIDRATLDARTAKLLAVG